MTYWVQATRFRAPSPSPTVPPPDGLAGADASPLGALDAGAEAALDGAVVAPPPPHAAAIRASTASPDVNFRSFISPPPRVPERPAPPMSRAIHDGELVLSLPDEAHQLSLEGQRLRR